MAQPGLQYEQRSGPTIARPQPGPSAACSQAAGDADETELDEQVDEASALLAAASFLMPWMLSVVFHIGLMLMLLFLMTGVGYSEIELSELHVPDVKWSDDPGVPQPDSSATEDLAQIQNVDLDRPAPEVTENLVATDVRIVAIADSSYRTSSLSGGFGGGDGRGSSFFGTRAGGKIRRIIYLVDSSTSMRANFNFVQAELLRSVSELGPLHQFTIIFFADGEPNEMKVRGASGMIHATRPNLAAAREWVLEQSAFSNEGQTVATQAIQRAFKLLGSADGKDQPAVIWILTDGILEQEPDRLIARLNSDKRVMVNTIAFVDRFPDYERLLQKIASENGGKYRFISEADLHD